MLIIEKFKSILFQDNNNEILRTLSLYRFFICIICIIFIAFEFNSTFYTEHAKITNPSFFFIPSFIIFTIFKWMCILAGIILAIGNNKYVFKILFLTSFVYINTYSYFVTNNFNYNTHLIFFLLLITFSNSTEYYSFFRKKDTSLNINSITMYDRYCIGFSKLYIGFLYLQAFLSKLINSGIEWFTSGDTIKTYILLRGTTLGKLFLSYPTSFKIFTALSGVFELSFIFILLFAKRDKLLGIAGILFHLSIFLLMEISFWFLWVLFIPLFILPELKFLKNCSNN